MSVPILDPERALRPPPFDAVTYWLHLDGRPYTAIRERRGLSDNEVRGLATARAERVRLPAVEPRLLRWCTVHREN